MFALAMIWSGLTLADRIAPGFRNYGTADGLPSPSTMDLAQDRAGYLWVATRDGLGRFDGKEFAVFRHAPGNPESLPCNDVQTVLAARDGRIWVGCESTGLAMLEHSLAHRFRRIAADPKSDELRGGDVFALAETRAGDLYIGTYAQGLARIASGQGKPLALDRIATIDPALRTATVLDMSIDDQDVLWVGTLDALWRIDAASSAHPGPVRKVAELPLVNSVHAARDGSLWVGVNGALFRRARDQDELLPLPLPETAGMIDGLADAEDGTVWVAARGGLLRIQNEALDWIRPRPAVPGALPGSDIRDLLIDHEGGLWLSSGGNGLSYLRPDWMDFQVFRHDPVDPTSPATGWRSGLTRCPDDSLWMLVRSGEWTRIGADQSVQRWTSKRHGTAFARRRASSVFCDANGRLWLPNRDGVLRYDPVQDVLENGLLDGEPWAAGPPEVLAQAPDGRIWMGALTAGLNILSMDGRNTVWRTGEHGIDNDDFEQIGIDARGSVWIADAGGLRHLDDSGKQFLPLEVLPKERVHAFAFLLDGQLLVHQLGRLILLHPEGETYAKSWQLGEGDGLPIAEAGTLVADGKRGAWLSNPRGLWWVDLEHRRIQPVSRAEGLADLRFEVTPSAVRQARGLWFLAGEGLLRIDEQWAKPLALVDLPLHWAALNFRHGGAPTSLMPGSARLSFGPEDQELAFSARLISFIEPRDQHYRFRIEGYDPDWVDVGAEGVRLISRLPAGEYRVQVQARNALGQRASTTLETHLQVAPPWWASGPAYAVAVLLAVGIVLGLWRINRRRLDARHAMALAEERRRHAESASAAKSEFLATVGHEIRTPMSGVLGMAELLSQTKLDERQRHYLETVQQSGKHLLRIVNDLLDLSRAEAGKLGLLPRQVVLPEVLREVFSGIAPLAARKGLQATIELTEDLPGTVLVDPVRLRQIVLNLANNALKFTEKGGIALRARQEAAGQVCIEVEDSGPGMSAEESAQLFQRFSQTAFGSGFGGSGLGLAIVHQLVRSMGGTVHLRSAPGVGSVFLVRLPLSEVGASPAPVVGSIKVSKGQETRSPASRCVLLVEDDATMREVIGTWLRDAGIEVRSADQGLLALHMADARIDAVISDIDLPGMSGLQLLPLIRQRVGRRVPALAITARSEAGTEMDARSAGFDGFLRKPFDAETLHAALQSVGSA